MSLKMRLARAGKKKRPFYRVVVANSQSPRDGKFIEKIGTLDPFKSQEETKGVVLDVEKAKSWLLKGAQPTDRVARMLDMLGIRPRPVKNSPQKSKPKKKAQERAAAAEAASAASEAA